MQLSRPQTVIDHAIHCIINISITDQITTMFPYHCNKWRTSQSTSQVSRSIPPSRVVDSMAGAPRIIFANPEVEPLHENGFEGMGLGERAGIETAEQAVRAVSAQGQCRRRETVS